MGVQSDCAGDFKCKEPDPPHGPASDQCFVCYWLYKTWPAFEEMCRPPQSKYGKFLEVHSFLHTPTQNSAGVGGGDLSANGGEDDGACTCSPCEDLHAEAEQSKVGMVDRNGQKVLINDGRGYGSLSLEKGKEMQLPNRCKCWDFWDKIRTHHKFRYFAMKLAQQSIIGDANAACKCLGQCYYTDLEWTKLQPECEYDENMQLGMFEDS